MGRQLLGLQMTEAEKRHTMGTSAIFNRRNCAHLTLNLVLASVNASAGSFYLWDPDQRQAVFEAALGHVEKRLHQFYVSPETGAMGWVFRHGKSVLVKDIREDHRFRNLENVGRYRTRSFMLIPLLTGNRTHGVINITERECPVPFDEKDLMRAEKYVQRIADVYQSLQYISRSRQEAEKLIEMRSNPLRL